MTQQNKVFKDNMCTIEETVCVSGTVTRGRCYDFFLISPKISAKKLAFLTQNKAKICEILIITLVFEKNANFLPKIVKNRRKL
jgi:hypothetical protein